MATATIGRLVVALDPLITDAAPTLGRIVAIDGGSGDVTIRLQLPSSAEHQATGPTRITIPAAEFTGVNATWYDYVPSQAGPVALSPGALLSLNYASLGHVNVSVVYAFGYNVPALRGNPLNFAPGTDDLIYYVALVQFLESPVARTKDVIPAHDLTGQRMLLVWAVGAVLSPNVTVLSPGMGAVYGNSG